MSIVFINQRFLTLFENICAVEIDKDALWFLQQFHVSEQLCFMNWQDSLHGFQFDYNKILDKHIKPKICIKNYPFVIYRRHYLVFKFQIPEPELMKKAFLIYTFQ